MAKDVNSLKPNCIPRLSLFGLIFSSLYITYMAMFGYLIYQFPSIEAPDGELSSFPYFPIMVAISVIMLSYVVYLITKITGFVRESGVRVIGNIGLILLFFVYLVSFPILQSKLNRVVEKSASGGQPLDANGEIKQYRVPSGITTNRSRLQNLKKVPLVVSIIVSALWGYDIAALDLGLLEHGTWTFYLIEWTILISYIGSSLSWSLIDSAINRRPFDKMLYVIFLVMFPVALIAYFYISRDVKQASILLFKLSLFIVLLFFVAVAAGLITGIIAGFSA